MSIVDDTTTKDADYSIIKTSLVSFLTRPSTHTTINITTGQDPSTGKILDNDFSSTFLNKHYIADFRGMGFLGLVQLNHFATTKTSQAKKALEESVITGRAYFPFAATGINITFFIMELMSEKRLFSFVFDSLEKNSVNSVQALTSQGAAGILIISVEAFDSLIHRLIDFLLTHIKRITGACRARVYGYT